MISPTQSPLSDNTQQWQETDIHAPAGFEPTFPANERPQTHALDRKATRSSSEKYCSSNALIPIYESTRRHIPEDSNSTHLKSHQQYI
jgi:hypothetical protein